MAKKVRIEPKHIILIATLSLISLIAILKFNTGYFKDLIFTGVIVTTLFLLYEKLRMTPETYAAVCLAILVHNLGAFGFYANNPILPSIPYDVITHVLGIFAATLIAANFLSYYLKTRKGFIINDITLLCMIFLIGLGIGSVVETMEFSGYLIWGAGEGFFQFGTGDYNGLNDCGKMTDIVGGGYFDTMEDLIANISGAGAAVALLGINFFVLKRKLI
jgi:predicted neutral ceramidase superfamily lipid hydrolase